MNRMYAASQPTFLSLSLPFSSLSCKPYSFFGSFIHSPTILFSLSHIPTLFSLSSLSLSKHNKTTKQYNNFSSTFTHTKCSIRSCQLETDGQLIPCHGRKTQTSHRANTSRVVLVNTGWKDCSGPISEAGLVVFTLSRYNSTDPLFVGGTKKRPSFSKLRKRKRKLSFFRNYPTGFPSVNCIPQHAFWYDLHFQSLRAFGIWCEGRNGRWKRYIIRKEEK